jgi:DNA polymerase IV
LAQRARGIDDRPVVMERDPKSISQETTFARNLSDEGRLHATLHELSIGVSRELRAKKLAGSTVKLKLRWADFETPTRQMRLDQPTDDGERIYAAAIQLFEKLWQPRRPVRLLGVGVSGLGLEARQMSLWEIPDEREERLLSAVRKLRGRYGEDAILRASEIGKAKEKREGQRKDGDNAGDAS